MQLKTAEKLAWILIYGGMLLAVLGWFVRDAQPVLSLGMIVIGGADALIGVLLILWRSRQPDPAPSKKESR